MNLSVENKDKNYKARKGCPLKMPRKDPRHFLTGGQPDLSALNFVPSSILAMPFKGDLTHPPAPLRSITLVCSALPGLAALRAGYCPSSKCHTRPARKSSLRPLRTGQLQGAPFAGAHRLCATSLHSAPLR